MDFSFIPDSFSVFDRFLDFQILPGLSIGACYCIVLFILIIFKLFNYFAGG